MKKTLCALGVLIIAPAFAEEKNECDCTQYPFKPNPPCYGKCVEKLTQDRSLFPEIKNADAGVLVGISVLSENKDYTDVEFGKIENKEDLQQAALDSIIDAHEAKRDVLTLPRAERDND